MLTHHQPSRPLKIANIIEEARWGGPQARITRVGRRLLDRQIETVVILPDAQSDTFVANLQAAGLDYRTLPLSQMSRTIYGFTRFVVRFSLDVWLVRKIIAEIKPDVVHCNGAAQWRGVIAGRMAGLPVLWHLNDTYMPVAIRIVFRLIANLPIGFLFSSERVYDYYRLHRFSKKLNFLVRPPVDARKYSVQGVVSDPQFSNLRGLKVGSIGNVNPAKDIETYIRMAKLLRTELGDGVKCLHAGAQFDSQAGYVGDVLSLNNDEQGPPVEMVGVLSDVRPFLDCLDIFVCSSRTESGPMSVFEAMAMGLPIVSTDVGDLAKMNAECEFARIVPVGDHEALARAVLSLAHSDSERRRLGSNGRRYVMSHLEESICVDAHSEAYYMAAKSPGVPQKGTATVQERNGAL